MGVVDAADPFTHGFVDSVFKDPGPGGNGVDLSPQQFHAVDVQSLANRIFFAHENFTFEAQESGGCRRCNTVLAGTGFSNDPGLAHLFRQQALP